MKNSQALKVGQDLAKRIGLINISNSNLAEALGVPTGSLPHVLGCSFSDFFEELKEVCPMTDHPITRKRVDPQLRKDHILNIALGVAEKVGIKNITRGEIAKAANVHYATVQNYFKTMEQLRNDLVRRAIKTENLAVIAHAIREGNRHVDKISAELKARALPCKS